ncbi:MAG: hypothetical protein AAFO03_04915 [Bacteroidota bacterium]
MSNTTTLVIKKLDDLSIYSQTTSGGGIEWMLKVVAVDPSTQQPFDHFQVLSQQLNALTVNYNSVKDEYQVTIVDQFSSPPNVAGVYLKATSDAIRYDFTADAQKRAGVIVIEDITIHMEIVRGNFLLDQHVLTMQITPASSGGSNTFDHEFWYM